jgi:hypothetical protein
MTDQLEKEWTEYFDGEGKDPTKLLTLLWEQNKELIEKRIAGGGFPFQPKREWVGLTDEEIKKIAKKHRWHESNVSPHLMPVFRSLEAKLKEKNT